MKKKYIILSLLLLVFLVVLLTLLIGKNPNPVMLGEGEQIVLSTGNPLLDKVTRWETKDEKTAEIKNNTIFGKKAGETIVTGHTPVRTFTANVSVIGFEQEEYRMAKDSTFLVKTIGAGSKVTYQVEDEAIASVNESGGLTGNSSGKTVLIGEYMGHTFRANLHVLGIKEIPMLVPGNEVTLEIETADEMEVIHYTSSNESVAKITKEDKGKTSVLTAVGGGSAEITALTEDGIEMKTTVTVEELSNDNVFLRTGEETTLTLKGGNTATWTSKDPAVATVKDGVITGKKEGKTKVIAKIGDKKFKCTVHVISLRKKYLMASGTEIDLPSGLENVQWETGDNVEITEGKLRAKNEGLFSVTASIGGQTLKTKVIAVNTDKIILNENAQKQLFYPDKINWESADPSVAKVENGSVIAVKEGSTSLTGTIGKQSVSVPVMVVSADTQVTVLHTNAVINGEEVTLDQAQEATVTDKNGQVRTFTVFKQNGGLFHGSTYESFLTGQGCAACSLTTVLRAYLPEYKDLMPYNTQEEIEKEVFGEDAWTDNYSKSSKMPVSLNGINEILNAKMIPSEYVRSFEDESAKADIASHLRTGNPVIVTVGMKNRETGKSDTRWSNSYHTIVLLGIKGDDTVYVGDSVNRKGNSGRIKEASLSDIINYMFPCTGISSSRYFSGRESSGGYVKVNVE